MGSPAEESGPTARTCRAIFCEQALKSRASQKPLPMPSVLVEILREYLKSWCETSERWLFSNSRGKPYSANNVVQRKLWPILDALKIPRCGLHAFRHTHSSLLLETGAPPTVAQAQLRHADQRITLGIYGHIIGESQRMTAEKVTAILRPNAPKSSAVGE